jgi:hypothetical protein
MLIRKYSAYYEINFTLKDRQPMHFATRLRQIQK